MIYDLKDKLYALRGFSYAYNKTLFAIDFSKLNAVELNGINSHLVKNRYPGMWVNQAHIHKISNSLYLCSYRIGELGFDIKVFAMFSNPAALRSLQKLLNKWIKTHSLSSKEKKLLKQIRKSSYQSAVDYEELPSYVLEELEAIQHQKQLTTNSYQLEKLEEEIIKEYYE